MTTPSGRDDPAFPRLHGRPELGWLNDPNGLCRVDGRFHVFFQYNPHSTRHHAIKWGHASSADLVRWREEPVALTNRPGEWDEFGCWSGCAVVDGGVPTLLYSGVLDDQGASRVLVARGDRSLRTWRQGRQPAADMPDDAAITDTRDPFVFEFEGRRYGLQGAGHRRGEPQVLVYDCEDLDSWKLLGPLLTLDDPVAAGLTPARVWECPNLVQLDGRWVLVVSLWREIGGDVVLDQVRYLIGELTMGTRGPVFRAEAAGELDDGPCFYAPQVLALDDRVLLWAWAREWGRQPAAVEEAGWASTLTFCRELTRVGDRLVSQPAPELTALRTAELEVALGRPFEASAFELRTTSAGTPARLHLVNGPDDRVAAVWDLAADQVTEPCVLVDGSIVEVFDGSGMAHTTRAYPESSEARWVLHSEDPSFTVRAWRLG